MIIDVLLDDVDQYISLKESLHIILMTIVFFDIIQLHSLGYRQMNTKEKIYENICLRVQLSYNILLL